MSYVTDISNLISELFKSVKKSILPLTEEELHKSKVVNNIEMYKHIFAMLNSAIRDHCHLIGRFRSLLCNEFNLKRRN